MQDTHPDDEQFALPCTLMRGGTSKGLYFRAEDLPPPGNERDNLLMAALGSQDLLQIDGLGGSRLVTAKLAIVAPSSRPDADVDYTYGIVPPGRGLVVYTSNCGNISAGVGPFAIDSGMVPAQGPVTQVRIFNTNTQKLLIAHVPVVNGKARVTGDFAIPGVPGTGAEIFMDYRATTGAKTGKVMPTGNAVDTIVMEDGRRIEASIGDVANPCVFVRATDIGCTGPALPLPGAIDNDTALIETLKELRGKAAALIGLASDWRAAEVESPALPLVVMVAPPHDYADSQARLVAASDMDLQARFIFYNKCHESMAGTGSMCIAAMSCIPGTLVRQAAASARPGSLRIGHPLGAMTVVCEAESGAGPGGALFLRLGFGRTARRLMQGVAWLPRSAQVAHAASVKKGRHDTASCALSE